jgi:hypothetical protein
VTLYYILELLRANVKTLKSGLNLFVLIKCSEFFCTSVVYVLF